MRVPIYHSHTYIILTQTHAHITRALVRVHDAHGNDNACGSPRHLELGRDALDVNSCRMPARQRGGRAMEGRWEEIKWAKIIIRGGSIFTPLLSSGERPRPI